MHYVFLLYYSLLFICYIILLSLEIYFSFEAVSIGKTKRKCCGTATEKLPRFYNITRFDGGISPPLEEGRNLREAVKLSPFREDERNGLAAVCEYYEKTGQHLFLKSNEIWSANQEEFIFLFTADHLTADLFERCRDYAYNAGMEMAHIGSGHMYTYVSPVFICGKVDDAARKAVENCRIYKTFRFSLHGWLEFHTGCLDMEKRSLYFNKSGRCMEKNLRNIFQELITKGE